MGKMLTKFATFLCSIGKGTEDVIAEETSPPLVRVAEVRVKSNAIHTENIATEPLARTLNLDNLQRQRETVAVTLLEMLDEGLFIAIDAIVCSRAG